jgi:hypothetical protein
MPNFTRTSSPSPRFPGDFSIEPNAGYAPSPVEQAYVDAVKDLVDRLAAHDVSDVAAHYPEQMFKDRQAVRAAAVGDLSADAAKFVAGDNPAGDRTHLAEIERAYTFVLPKFGTRNSEQLRFDGDFDVIIASGYAPGSDEQTWLDSIEATKTELFADKRSDSDATLGYSPSIIELRQRLRADICNDLRKQIEGLSSSGKSVKAADDEVLLMRGRYQAKRDRLARRLFNVKLSPEEKSADDGKDSVLFINLLGGLEPPHDKPSSDKEKLYIQINKALTVVTKVTEGIDDRAEQGLLAWMSGPNKKLQKRSRLLQKEFLGRLYDVAKIGLELEFTDLALLTLQEVRNDFFVREAGRIKSMYGNRLGVWAVLAASALILVYIGFYTKHLTWPWGFEHKSFLLAACGAAIGTWASFSFRQVQFTFDDLVMVEEGSLDPPMRIFFVIVLTMAACALFWNGAVNIEIGSLKTNSDAFRHSGSIALLIGLFCGLSERALATAIAGRAAALVKGVAGA